MSTASFWSTDLASAEDARQNHATPNTRATYRIDPAASRIEFTIGKRLFFVAHMLVTGRFGEFEGTISLDEQEPANSRAEVTIGVGSVDTRGPMGKRDKHLRNADFLDVDRYPHMIFASRRIDVIDRAAGRYRVTGDLTVRNVTRQVELDALYAPALTAGHARRITLTLTGQLNRRDFGLDWNRPYIKIADELTLTLAVEAIRA